MANKKREQKIENKQHEEKLKEQSQPNITITNNAPNKRQKIENTNTEEGFLKRSETNEKAVREKGKNIKLTSFSKGIKISFKHHKPPTFDYLIHLHEIRKNHLDFSNEENQQNKGISQCIKKEITHTTEDTKIQDMQLMAEGEEHESFVGS